MDSTDSRPPSCRTFHSKIIYLEPAEPRQFPDVYLISSDGYSQMANAAMLASLSHLMYGILRDAWLEESTISISTELNSHHLQLFCEFVSQGTMAISELNKDVIDSFCSMGVNLNAMSLQQFQELKDSSIIKAVSDSIKLESVTVNDESVTKGYLEKLLGTKCKGKVAAVNTEFELLRKGADFLARHLVEHGIRDKKHCYSEEKLVALIATHYISHHAKVLEPDLGTSRYCEEKLLKVESGKINLGRQPSNSKDKPKSTTKACNKKLLKSKISKKKNAKVNQYAEYNETSCKAQTLPDERLSIKNKGDLQMHCLMHGVLKISHLDKDGLLSVLKEHYSSSHPDSVIPKQEHPASPAAPMKVEESSLEDWPSVEPECSLWTLTNCSSDSLEDEGTDHEGEEEVKPKKSKVVRRADGRKYVLKCKHCSENFDSYPELVAHVKESHPKQPPKPPERTVCPECGKSLRGTDQAVSDHMKRFHTEKKHPCPQCSQMFATDALVRHHIQRAHLTFICDTCGKSVKKKQERAHQLAYHTPEDKKPFVCKTCVPVRGFVEKHHYEEHMNTHTGEKPFKCDSCPGVAYASRGNLAAHVRSVHKGIKRKSK